MQTTGPSLIGARLILGVTGSIAAYKAVGLLRLLRRESAQVRVVMTAGACRFVTPLTFEVLSGAHVATDLFEAHQEMLHLSLPEEADAVVIAPATANCLAKAALGLADDLLSTMLLTTHCPVIVAPAMDGDMWRHPTVVEHVATLRRRGVLVVEPEEGPLASGHIGRGRLAEEQHILAAVQATVRPRRDWSGRRVLISAGPTQEAIDPVRFISNRSSGKMGYALAEAARDRGAEVVLVSGPTALTPPGGIALLSVTTAEEMRKAVLSRLSWSDTVIMAAAVADFRPVRPSMQKLKKRHRPITGLELEPTEDILLELSARRTTQLLVGFAAETEDLLAHAREKLHAKDVDLLVANDVTAVASGFGSDSNRVILLDRNGQTEELPLLSKRDVADRILDRMLTVPVVRRSGKNLSRTDRKE
ncbi:MAG: phosphopantothenoylcysteine decarboxylase/phosphopantothenoylcysteine synthetase [Nitrospira sp.]|nr:MAG: phosphopantothenoylcysteine decarboxylase/phosphopantothenoylcysteine synthetase [Nitrospira sp.]